jgi:hypothetical protein
VGFMILILYFFASLLSAANGKIPWKYIAPGGLSSSLRPLELGLEGNFTAAAFGDFNSDRLYF